MQFDFRRWKGKLPNNLWEFSVDAKRRSGCGGFGFEFLGGVDAERGLGGFEFGF
jgi:hypothetical protein